MGTLWSTYNPFNVYGQYNLKKSFYENKRAVITACLFLVVLIIAVIVVLWTAGNIPTRKSKTYYDLPSTKVGYGPHGYGTYLPPKEMLARSIAES